MIVDPSKIWLGITDSFDEGMPSTQTQLFTTKSEAERALKRALQARVDEGVFDSVDEALESSRVISLHSYFLIADGDDEGDE